MLKMKHVRVVLLAALAATCALAVTAGSALAWNTTSGGLRVTGTLTLKKEGEKRTCTTIKDNMFYKQAGTVSGKEYFQASGWGESGVDFDCDVGNDLRWEAGGYLTSEGTEINATVYGIETESVKGPFGIWSAGGTLFKVPWTNAVGGVASHITLNENTIGTMWPYWTTPIKASGTLYFTTLAGGDLTYP